MSSSSCCRHFAQILKPVGKVSIGTPLHPLIPGSCSRCARLLTKCLCCDVCMDPGVMKCSACLSVYCSENCELVHSNKCCERNLLPLKIRGRSVKFSDGAVAQVGEAQGGTFSLPSKLNNALDKNAEMSDTVRRLAEDVKDPEYQRGLFERFAASSIPLNNVFESMTSVLSSVRAAVSSLWEKMGDVADWVRKNIALLGIAFCALTPIARWGIETVTMTLTMMSKSIEFVGDTVVLPSLNLFLRLIAAVKTQTPMTDENGACAQGGFTGNCVMAAVMLLTLVKSPEAHVLKAIRYVAPLAVGLGALSSGLEAAMRWLPENGQAWLVECGFLQPLGELSRLYSISVVQFMGMFDRAAATDDLSTLELPFKVAFCSAREAVVRDFHIETCGKSTGVSMMISKLVSDSGCFYQSFKAHIRDVPKKQAMTSMLYGPAGSGKSSLAMSLSVLLCPSNSSYNVAWTRTVGDKYWSGYAGEEAVIFDDISQGSNEVKTEICAELIRLIGPVPFRPIMADVDHKGILAEPKCIIASTNDSPDRVVNGINMRAFRRRFLHWWVEPEPRYMKEDGTLDEMAVKNMPGAERVRFRHIRIHKVTFDAKSKPKIHRERSYTVVEMAATMVARTRILNEIEVLKVTDLKVLKGLLLEDEMRAVLEPSEPEEEKGEVGGTWGHLFYESKVLVAKTDREGRKMCVPAFMPDRSVADTMAGLYHMAGEDEKDSAVAQVCADCFASDTPGGCSEPGCREEKDAPSDREVHLARAQCDDGEKSPFLAEYFKQVFGMAANCVLLVALSKEVTIGAAAWNALLWTGTLAANRQGVCCPSCLVADKDVKFAMCEPCAFMGSVRAGTWFTRRFMKEFDIKSEVDVIVVAPRMVRFASPLLRYLDLCNGLGLDINMSDRALRVGMNYWALTNHPDKGGSADLMILYTSIFAELARCRAAILLMARTSSFFPFAQYCLRKYVRFPTDLDVNVWQLHTLHGLGLIKDMHGVVMCGYCDGYHLNQNHCYACADSASVVRSDVQYSVRSLVTLFVDLLPQHIGVLIQKEVPSRANRVLWLQQTIRAIVGIIHAGGSSMVENDFVRLARESPRSVVKLISEGLPRWCEVNRVELKEIDMHVANLLCQAPAATDQILDELQYIVPEDQCAEQCRLYTERRNKRWSSKATYANFLDRARKFVSSPLVVDLSKVMAVIGVLTVAYKGARFVISCFTNSSEAQIGSNEDDLVVRRHDREKLVRERQLARHKQRRDAVQAIANVGDSISATTTVLERISNNMAMVERSVVGSKPYRLCGLFLQKKILMVPRHFFLNPDQTQVCEGTPIIIKCGTITYAVPFKSVALVDSGKKDGQYLDVCFYDCSTDPVMRTKVTDYPSVVDKFSDELVTDELDSFGGFLLLKATNDNEVEWVSLPEVRYEAEPLEYGYAMKGTKLFYTPTQYMYAPQESGDCGSILMGVSKSLGGHVTILGYHVADRVRRQKKMGVSMPLVRSDVIVEMGTATAQMWIEHIDKAYKGGLSDHFKVLARSVNPRLGPPNFKTSYIASPIFDDPLLETVKRAPALLGDPADHRSKLSSIELVEKELNRAFKDVVEEYPYNPVDVRLIADSLVDSLCAHQDDTVPCRRLSVGEALNGGVGSPFSFLKPMCVVTSSGWPWCTMPEVSGKRPLIVGTAGEYVIGDVRLKRRLIEVWLDAINGRLFSPIVPNDKDELRSPEKIELEQTRLVNCMQAEHTITSRMVFGAFVNYVHSIHTISTSAVGMDVLSGDWSDMVTRWIRVGTNGFDLDFSKFERYLNRQLAEMCLYVVDQWYKRFGGYSEEDSLVRRGLVGSMVEGILIVDNRFILQPSVLTSGMFGTSAIFGNLMSQFFIRLAWLHLSRQHAPRLIGMDSFERKVSGSVYSDDNVWVVADDVGEWFNSIGVSRSLGLVGVVCTPADKGGEFGPNRNFLDLQFLKMRSVRDYRFPGRSFLAVPDREDLLPSLKWITRSLPSSIALVVNMNAVLRRCFGWEKQRWVDFRIELIRSLARVGIHEPLLTWEVLLNCDEMIRQLGADDFVFDVSPVSNLQDHVRLVGSIDFLRRVVPLNRIRRDDGAIAQMDISPPEEIGNISDRVVRHVLGVGNMPEQGDETVVTERTLISHLTRRMYPVFNATTFGPLNRLPSVILWAANPSATFDKMGPLEFWGYPFAWYQGSLDIMTLSGLFLELAWEHHPTVLFSEGALKPAVDFGRTTSASGLLGCGFSNNAIIPPGPAVFVQTNLPSLSQSNFMSFPRTADHFITDTPGGAGYLSMRAIASDAAMTNTSLWVGGGEDMRFMRPLCIPQIRYYASAWAAAEGDGAVAQMDGVKSDAVEVRVVGGLGHLPAIQSVAEGQQSFTSMAADWQYIETIPWSASDANGTILYLGNFPDFAIGGFNKWAFDAFTYFRGDIHVRIQVDSPIYQAGRLIAAFLPSVPTSDAAMYLDNPVNWTWFDHAIIYAGGSREVIFPIEYSFPHNYFDLVSGIHLTGSFVLFVGDFIRTGTSPDSASVNISVSIRNSKFLVRRALPIASGTKIKHKIQRKKGCEDEKDDFAIVQGGHFSRVVASPNDMVKTWNCGVFNQSMMNRSPINNKLALTRNEGSAVSVPGPTIGDFTRRPTSGGTLDWSAGDAVGTVLATYDLTIAPASLTVLTPLLDELRFVSSMEYASLPFDLWRCKALGFRIEIVATKFHSGRLAVVTKLGSNFDPYITINDAMSQYAQIIDVADPQNTHDIIVPWMMDIDWLYCPKRHMALGVTKEHVAFGTIHFVVLNELRAVEAVADNVGINVYLFAEGVEFRGQSMSMQNHAIELLPFTARKGDALRRG